MNSFKYGDTREDGKRFVQYRKNRSCAAILEVWTSSEKWQNNHEKKIRRNRENKKKNK